MFGHGSLAKVAACSKRVYRSAWEMQLGNDRFGSNGDNIKTKEFKNDV